MFHSHRGGLKGGLILPVTSRIITLGSWGYFTLLIGVITITPLIAGDGAHLVKL